MGAWAYLILIVAALALGSLAQAVVHSRLGYEWIVTGIGAGLAGSLAGNAGLGGLGAWGPTLDGLHIVPALIGAVVMAALLEGLLWVLVRPTATS